MKTHIRNVYPYSIVGMIVFVISRMIIDCASIWATARQNVSSGVSDQARHKPACAATEAS